MKFQCNRSQASMVGITKPLYPQTFSFLFFSFFFFFATSYFSLSGQAMRAWCARAAKKKKWALPNPTPLRFRKSIPRSWDWGTPESRSLAEYYGFHTNISFTFQAIKNLYAHIRYLRFWLFWYNFFDEFSRRTPNSCPPTFGGV